MFIRHSSSNNDDDDSVPRSIRRLPTTGCNQQKDPTLSCLRTPEIIDRWILAMGDRSRQMLDWQLLIVRTSICVCNGTGCKIVHKLSMCVHTIFSQAFTYINTSEALNAIISSDSPLETLSSVDYSLKADNQVSSGSNIWYQLTVFQSCYCKTTHMSKIISCSRLGVVTSVGLDIAFCTLVTNSKIHSCSIRFGFLLDVWRRTFDLSCADGWLPTLACWMKCPFPDLFNWARHACI